MCIAFLLSVAPVGGRHISLFRAAPAGLGRSLVLFLRDFCFEKGLSGLCPLPPPHGQRKKTTTLPERARAQLPLSGVAVCWASFSGLGCSRVAPGISGAAGSALSVGAAFSAGVGSVTIGSALPGAGCLGAGALVGVSASGPMVFSSDI